MKPNDLILRCYAEKIDDQWSIVCIDICLAAQADTLAQAKKKLEAMILDYVNDAVVGEDKPYAAQLMSRKAPLSQRLKYYKIYWLTKLGNITKKKIVDEAIPMSPCYSH